MCAILPGLCEILAAQWICLKELEPLIRTEKIVPENVNVVRECLQCIAAGSLLLAKDLCRQMERPVTIEQLIKKLQMNYRIHEDRGWMRTRMEYIRRDMAEIDQMTNTPGILTEADQQRLGSLYLRLALDCVRTGMFAELEPQVILPKQEQTANMLMRM